MKTATNSTVDSAALPAVRSREDTGPLHTDVSWVDRCQRQFGDSDRRLHNLVDDENCVCYDGV